MRTRKAIIGEALAGSVDALGDILVY